MAVFMARRVLEAIPVLIGITILAFAVLQLVPGDPARLQLGPQASSEAVASLRTGLGLDRSLPAQYVDFLKETVTFSFGESYRFRQPVSEIIGPRILPSVFLICYSLLVAVLLAVPLALVSALRRDKWIDHAIRIFTTTAFAMPMFWLGLLLTLLFAVELGWLPTSGYGDTFVEHIRSLTIPAITVGLYLGAPLLRSLRTNLIDNLDAEYTEAARARGLSSRRVVLRHVMRNSLMSTITLLSFFVSVLLSSTVIVESVFSIPGLGSLLVESVTARDFPVVQTLAVMFGFATVVVSIVTDIIYATADPRVRL